MRLKSSLYSTVAAVGIACVLAFTPASFARPRPRVAIDGDDIGGVVTGASGPEAGVWVIAETTDLPTRYTKMVVNRRSGTLRRARSAKAKYKVWVRGYGLVDFPEVDGEPGKQLNLQAVPAPNEAAAPRYIGRDLLSGCSGPPPTASSGRQQRYPRRSEDGYLVPPLVRCRHACRFSCLPGSPSTFGESTRHSRAPTLYIWALGRSGTTCVPDRRSPPSWCSGWEDRCFRDHPYAGPRSARAVTTRDIVAVDGDRVWARNEAGDARTQAMPTAQRSNKDWNLSLIRRSSLI